MENLPSNVPDSADLYPDVFMDHEIWKLRDIPDLPGSPRKVSNTDPKEIAQMRRKALDILARLRAQSDLAKLTVTKREALKDDDQDASSTLVMGNKTSQVLQGQQVTGDT